MSHFAEMGCTTKALHKEILELAIPNIISNLSTPLISLVDSFVAGHLPDDSTGLSAVAVGASCFLLVYNMFIFLRKGTTGLTAQARGASNVIEVESTAIRSIVCAVLIGSLLILFRHAIIDGLILEKWIRAPPQIKEDARLYIFPRMYGAPFALGNYAITGFLNGMAKARYVLKQQIILNTMNATLCVFLALSCSLGVAGIGYAAALANFIAFLYGLFAVNKAVREFRIQQLGAALVPRCSDSLLQQVLDTRRLWKMFVLSSTISMRSFCLTITISSFTALTATFTSDQHPVLAANLLLLQLHDLVSTGTDGFSNAAETLVGESIGRQNESRLKAVITETLKIGLLIALCYSVLYFSFGRIFFAFMTSEQTIAHEADNYLVWVIVGPLFAVWAFLFDGFFVGATLAREMMLGMVLASVAYLITLVVVAGNVVDIFLFNNGQNSLFVMPILFMRKNDELWFCFYAFMLYRAIALLFFFPTLQRKASQISNEDHYRHLPS